MSDINVRTLAMPSSVPAVHRWLALPVILAGTFMVTLDFFIVNVAIPSIQRDLHAGTAAIEWIVAGYGLSYAALLIIGGAGWATCTDAAVSSAVALRSSPWLRSHAALHLMPDGCVLARITQGVGAALLSPQVLAILGTIYTGAERARAFAAYGVVLGIASACGQLIGGLLIEINAFGLGWRACFLVNLPIGAGALLLAQVTVPESRGATSARLDLGGAVLVTLGIGGLLLPLIEGRAHGWPLWTWLSFVAAAAVAMMLVVHQRRRARARSGPPYRSRDCSWRAASAPACCQHWSCLPASRRRSSCWHSICNRAAAWRHCRPGSYSPRWRWRSLLRRCWPDGSVAPWAARRWRRAHWAWRWGSADWC